MTNEELVTAIGAVNTQLANVDAAIKAAGDNVPQSVVDAFTALQTTAAGLVTDSGATAS